ncbi:4-hydroxy-3-methylbut-2-enyl diphosphate reductase [Cohaesibacter celericrescens]|uniref:4-hydroxy-3-methylbut-2-enyl diphosphate reductase n=1 Tax=Cohaesibacter celericrescens TaxID=2067669 RepID=A0A2N5XKB6_9HYPH|nr:4-hydroxy-3-methylbut-2-enyl diphosphate reductase [Cohaesibacter celericrescens]PLW74956.1 4-hydroxy-3-methylbut-2-enyl diphosphate reductase [Cohaesibacter celericrescens]
MSETKPPLDVFLCAPRGFCAGVDRAIQIVDLALQTYGAPVYVRHEIVHNKFVVEGLKAKGAIFVEELDEIPATTQPVIFSAHGVPKSVPAAAQNLNFFYLDATCPLVSKVHKEAMLHDKRGHEIVLIGHEGHPEVIGTMGQLADNVVKLIETVADVEAFEPQDPDNLAWITQTTLSLDDTADIIAALKRRFPAIRGPNKDDICYATTNRQEAVKIVAPRADVMIVVGAPNSSNSKRLREVGERSGCRHSLLLQRASEIDWDSLGTISSVAITAGASAPEILVEEVIAAFSDRYEVKVEVVVTAKEDIIFNIPRELREAAVAAGVLAEGPKAEAVN